MRDRFKHRHWDNQIKKMRYGDIQLSSDGKPFILGKNNDNEGMKVYDIDNVITMQCTGLKDKNGKLIYEGDIIVIPNQYPFYDYKNEEDMKQNLNETQGEIRGENVLNYIGIVEWIYSQWQYVYHCVNPLKSGISEGINNGLNDEGFKENENTCYEVIGNIYENSELLNKGK